MATIKDPENTLIMDMTHGRVVIEMLHAVAPGRLDDRLVGAADDRAAVQLELHRHRRLLFLAHRRHFSPPVR